MEVRDLGFRIERAAFPVGSPPAVAGSSVASGPGQVLTTGGVKDRPELVARHQLDGFGPELGVKSIRSSTEKP